MAVLTWRAWTHPYVDFGRELYVPWQMLEGRALYRDLAYLNGPLSPSLNAALFGLFGVSLTTLLCANAAVLAGVALLLRGLLRRIADEWTVLLGNVVFLLVFAFGQATESGNNNFLCPYSHEMTHGLLLGLACLESLLRWIESRRLRWCLAAGLALGLTALTKPEFFLATLATCLAALLVDAFARRRALAHSSRRRPVWTAAAALATAACAPPAVAWFALSTHMPARVAADGLLRALRSSFDPRLAQLPFYRFVMGLDDLPKSLALMGAGLVLSALLVLVAACVGFGVGRLVARGDGRRDAGVRRAPLAPLLASGAALVVGVSLSFAGAEVWTVAARAWPLLVLAALVLAARRASRAVPDVPDGRRAAAGVLWSVFAFVLLGKILLKAGPAHYGFVLAAPAALLVLVAAFDWIPRALEPRGVSRFACRAVLLGVVGGGVASSVQTTLWCAEVRTAMVGVAGDRLRARPETAAVVNGLLSAIEQQARPADTLAVLPEGCMLDYLLRRTNSTPYTSVMPPELAIFGEPAITAAFAAHPPDLIALLPRDVAVYGRTGFGQDFGLELWAWLRAHYDEVAEVPGSGWEQAATLLRLRAR